MNCKKKGRKDKSLTKFFVYNNPYFVKKLSKKIASYHKVCYPLVV